MLGICLIALGLFFGASLYSEAVGIIGNTISSIFFGLFGVAGYALPVIFVVMGILIIVFSDGMLRPSTFWFTLLGIIAIQGIIHVYTRGVIEDVKIIDYYKEAYLHGVGSQAGGGILGSLIVYPSLMLLGQVGTYILLVAIVFIAFLMVTRISLKSMGSKIGHTIKEGAQNVAHQMDQNSVLYTEDLSDEGSISLKVKSGKTTSKPTRVEEIDIFTLMEEEPPSPKKKRRSAAQTQKKTVPAERPKKKVQIVDPNSNRVKDGNRELEFMPISGSIEKRKNAGKNIDDALVDMQYEPSEKLQSEDFFLPIVPSVSTYESTAKEKAKAKIAASQKEVADSDTDIPKPAAVMEYQRPPITLLNSPEPVYSLGGESPQEKGKLLVDTLASFNISARILNISVGPVITRFELQPAQGVRVNRITTLSKDIALALAAPRVRIEAPIPGKAAIGIEIPNKDTAMVLLREVIESREFMAAKSPISFALGKDIAGKILTADLDRMPHMLIAGSTGSGKSVCINDIIISMIYKAAPSDVRMILIDPKVVELKIFSALPHLLLPVVTDPKKAAGALKWAVLEMEQRYQKMSKYNARDLSRYNSLAPEEERMPKLVIIIDELADLMMVAAKDVEESICRIAQLGRASGLHLIVATQRPSTDVITGLIKANIPSRIAFMVSSAVDSRVIMDESGAEKLLGKGDMLFHANGASKLIRAQGAYVSDEEVESIMDFFQENQIEPPVPESTLDEAISTATITGTVHGNGRDSDELLSEAVKIVLDSGQASISMIQRRLRVGYARAARLIDIMEQMNIVSGFDGSKPRKLLIDHADYARMFGGETDEGDI